MIYPSLMPSESSKLAVMTWLPSWKSLSPRDMVDKFSPHQASLKLSEKLKKSSALSLSTTMRPSRSPTPAQSMRGTTKCPMARTSPLAMRGSNALSISSSLSRCQVKAWDPWDPCRIFSSTQLRKLILIFEENFTRTLSFPVAIQCSRVLSRGSKKKLKSVLQNIKMSRLLLAPTEDLPSGKVDQSSLSSQVSPAIGLHSKTTMSTVLKLLSESAFE